MEMALFKKNKEPKMVEREDGLVDYNIYVMKKGERILNIVLAAAVLFGIGYVFYKNPLLSALLVLLAFKWPKMRTKQIIEKRKKDLTVQFKDMLYSLSSSLSAGKSVESGLKEALNDLRIIYPDEDAYIIQETSYIVRGLELNETVEDMFGQFAARSHIEDIENFTDIFSTCKRTGGDIVQVIRSTSQTIGEKIEIQQEIATMIAGKRFEFKVLMLMPIFLILLLTYTAGDYMSPIFMEKGFKVTQLGGPVVMTIAIALFGIAYLVGTKIMKIDV
jgi:tight adherence protein B